MPTIMTDMLQIIFVTNKSSIGVMTRLIFDSQQEQVFSFWFGVYLSVKTGASVRVCVRACMRARARVCMCRISASSSTTMLCRMFLVYGVVDYS